MRWVEVSASGAFRSGNSPIITKSGWIGAGVCFVAGGDTYEPDAGVRVQMIARTTARPRLQGRFSVEQWCVAAELIFETKDGVR
jgi:hypothetical protein